MFSFLKNIKSEDKNKIILVLDIGSSSVGGAIFYTEGKNTPKIIFSVRELISVQKEIKLDLFFEETMKSLKRVLEKISINTKNKPNKCFCVLSSPWFASQTRVINFEKKENFIFNEELADSLIKKEIALFEEEHLIKLSNGDNKIRPIELKNLKIVLNGYPTDNPYGKEVSFLEMTIFISMTQEKIAKNIEDLIGKFFVFDKIKFSSFTISSFTVARDMFINQESFLLINIGGELTDISMIKKDIIKESVSFPMGKNFLIRGVADFYKCETEEARSLITLYKDGHMFKDLLMKFDPVVTRLKNDWLKIFQESLSNLTTDISIPSTVFVTVDEDLEDFFTRTIRTEQFNQYALTESKFKLIFLGTKALHGIVLYEKDIKRDPFIIIESIYINQFLS